MRLNMSSNILLKMKLIIFSNGLMNSIKQQTTTQVKLLLLMKKFKDFTLLTMINVKKVVQKKEDLLLPIILSKILNLIFYLTSSSNEPDNDEDHNCQHKRGNETSGTVSGAIIKTAVNRTGPVIVSETDNAGTETVEQNPKENPEKEEGSDSHSDFSPGSIGRRWCR